MKSLSKTTVENHDLLGFLLARSLRRAGQTASVAHAQAQAPRSSLIFYGRPQVLLIFAFFITMGSGCSLYRSQARKALENDGINCARGLPCSAAAATDAATAAAGYEARRCRALTTQDIESFSPTDTHVVFDEPTQAYLVCRY